MTDLEFYDLGDLVRCSSTFATNSANVDPAAVMFKVKTPAGTETTYVYGADAELVKSATGVYYVDVNTTEVGEYSYRFWSTGTGQAAGERQFYVVETLFEEA